MNKKILIIPIVIAVVIIVVNFSLETPNEKNSNVFHITLASPDLYYDGVYTNTFHIDEGEYYFRFVPNGSSPKILSVILNGQSFDFSEDFKLENTIHQTGVSEYFTWNYNGNDVFSILEKQEILIIINPNGNIMGSVSVDIIKNLK